MGKLWLGFGCASLLGWLSCGGQASDLKQACEKSCERTVACAPEFGSVSDCKQQCAKAEEIAAERCLTAEKLNACSAKLSCDDYLACAFETTGCDDGDDGFAGSGGFSVQGGAGGTAMTAGGGQAGGLGGLGGTADAPVTIDTFPRVFVSAFCTHIFNCCDRAVAALFGATPQECVGALRPAVARELAEVQTSVDAGRTRFDADTAAACIDVLAKSRCGSAAAANWDSVCDGVFVGLLPIGARCTAADECTDGICSASAASNMRTCQKRPTLGERCVASCATGFACDPLSSRCVAVAKLGDACDFDFDCASDFCDDGVCAPLAFCELL